MNKTQKTYVMWTPDEITLLKNLVKEGKGYKEICKHFKHRTPSSVEGKGRKKLHLKSTYRYKKWSHDINFWSQINPITAYFAGFSMADGHLAKDRHSFLLSLGTKDLNLLIKLKELTKFTGEIRSYERKNYKKETLKKVSTLNIGSCKQWYYDLEKYWGIIPQKTRRAKPPLLNDDFIKLCWILGYYDGDGWYSIRKNNTKRLTMGVVSCNFDILTFIKETLDRIFPEMPKTGAVRAKLSEIRKCDPCNYWEFRICGVRALIIYDYFRQFKLPKLARKLNNPAIIERIEYYKQKFPELFYRKLEIPEQYKQYSMPDTPIYIPDPQPLISQAIPESEIPINNQTLVAT